MAWYDKLPTKRRNSSGRMADVYRGCYRGPDKRKCTVKDSAGHTAFYFRKLEALRAAERAETAALAQAPSLVSPSGTITWDEWWARIGGNRHAFGNADKTEAINARDYISPTFGHERLNMIKRQMVKDWIQALVTAGLGASHIEKIYYLFKWTMNEALESEPPVLHASPCGKKMGLPKPKNNPMLNITYADAAEYRKLGLRKDYCDVLDFGLDTGMRPGEIMGMHADQINWKTKWTKVSNTMVPKPRAIKAVTKTGDTRDAPLTDEALAILTNACNGRDMTSGCGVPHLNGQPCTSEIVFRSTLGRPMSPELMTEALTRLQEKHGLEHKTSYGGRHGHVTTQVGNGTPIAEVAKNVGHSGPNATKQTMNYVHQTEETRARVQAARNKATGASPTLTVVATRPGSNDHETHGAARGANLARRKSEEVAGQQDQRTG